MQIPEPIPTFSYFDGIKIVHADAYVIYQKLLILTRSKPNELAEKVFSVKPDATDETNLVEAAEASLQLIALVRDLFHMQLFNAETKQGAQGPHCLAVWREFSNHCWEMKKKIDNSLTTSQPTAAQASSQPTSSTSV